MNIYICMQVHRYIQVHIYLERDKDISNNNYTQIHININIFNNQVYV